MSQRTIREAVAWIGAADGFPAADLDYGAKCTALAEWKAGPLRNAYRAKAKELHPDRNPSPTATAEFQELEEVHRALQGLQPRRPAPQPVFYSVIDMGSATTTGSGFGMGGFTFVWVS